MPSPNLPENSRATESVKMSKFRRVGSGALTYEVSYLMFWGVIFVVKHVSITA